jgi:hypothetical protein
MPIQHLDPQPRCLPLIYIQIRFLSEIPGFRQIVKFPKKFSYLTYGKINLCGNTWTDKLYGPGKNPLFRSLFRSANRNGSSFYTLDPLLPGNKRNYSDFDKDNSFSMISDLNS